MNTIFIIIPYVAKEAQGRELELAVAGWKRHFKENHHIFIVGDWSPVCDQDNVSFIECPRVAPIAGEYLPHLDRMNKILRAAEVLHPDPSSYFFLASDDCYAVNDFSGGDVIVRKSQGKMPVLCGDSGGWFGDAEKTRLFCEMMGWPTWNYATHIPYCFEWEKLLDLADLLDLTRNSFVLESLYYNRYFKEDPIILEKGNPYKLPVQSFVSDEKISEAFASKIWIYNSVNGWSERLEKKLADHYGIQQP